MASLSLDSVLAFEIVVVLTSEIGHYFIHEITICWLAPMELPKASPSLLHEVVPASPSPTLWTGKDCASRVEVRRVRECGVRSARGSARAFLEQPKATETNPGPDKRHVLRRDRETADLRFFSEPLSSLKSTNSRTRQGSRSV